MNAFGSFRAMGSDIGWWADDDVGEEVAQIFEEVEQCCSRFRPESELTRINESQSEVVAVSGLMAEVIEAADKAFSVSEGAVDPTVHDAVVASGYDRDLAHASRRRSQPPAVPGWHRVTLEGTTLIRPPGVTLDFGGIAKGWTAHRAREISGANLVDAGGDICVRGPATVQVHHANTNVAELSVKDCGVATSGIDRRRWAGGHHLIDPSTGQPAETNVLAATVIAADTMLAETVARTIVLLGAMPGLGWAESLDDVRGALLTTQDGTTLSFPRTKELLL
jgi:thiamine biosynthesis lipoprotein